MVGNDNAVYPVNRSLRVFDALNSFQDDRTIPMLFQEFQVLPCPVQSRIHFTKPRSAKLFPQQHLLVTLRRLLLKLRRIVWELYMLSDGPRL